MIHFNFTMINIAAILIILYQQLHRGDFLKFISSAIFFYLCFEAYEFSSNIISIPVYGSIVLFFFYEAVEIIDRLFLSKISYEIVGLLLDGLGVSKEVYTVVHWLVVRLIILYFVVLPVLDNEGWIILMSIVGIIVVIGELSNKFNTLDFDL